MLAFACGDDNDDNEEGYTPPDQAELDEDHDVDDFAAPDDELDDDDIVEADDPRLQGTVDPQALASTDPLLGFVLYATPGTAKLVRVDPVTGVTSVAVTHAFASHWLPIGVAGNKLLWQRSDTGETSLWTIDGNGNYVSHVVFYPAAGWYARGIAFDQDGVCPTPPAAQTSYTILWEGPPPGNLLAQWPYPQLWHVADNGTVTSTENFPQRYSWTELRDFRANVGGYGALIHRPQIQMFGADNTYITWYGRNAGGTLERLRTDTYTAAAGYTACTSHAAGVPCDIDFVDEAPLAGHSLTSLVTTATRGGLQLPATYVLWTKTDGTAKTYRLQFGAGKQLGPAGAVTTALAGTSAVSLSSKPPTVCPIMSDDPPPPAFDFDPVIDPPPCPACG
ncbi:MAG TPA: hypothetical protein VG755_19345 [Nannocystaceae bacterium]|nr:hypothetical protein [Nannocystaceae bacterium]